MTSCRVNPLPPTLWLAYRQPVAVGRHHLELLVLDHHEQAVQVVADVLLGHRVLD